MQEKNKTLQLIQVLSMFYLFMQFQYFEFIVSKGVGNSCEASEASNVGLGQMHKDGVAVGWELDLDLEDLGLNPCLAMKLAG